MMRHSKVFMCTIYGLWGCLGAYRGTQKYNKEYKKDYKHYMKHVDFAKKPQYYYLSSSGYAIGYLFGYIIPLTGVGFVIDELYNVEKVIRGIEEDNT